MTSSTSNWYLLVLKSQNLGLVEDLICTSNSGYHFSRNRCQKQNKNDAGLFQYTFLVSYKEQFDIFVFLQTWQKNEKDFFFFFLKTCFYPKFIGKSQKT